MSVTHMIIATEAREACEAETDLTERVKVAMRAAKDHWMKTNEEEQFKGALVAAMNVSTEEEKDIITRSLQPMKVLSAMMSGVPVNFEALEGMDTDDLIPLQKLWHEIKAE